jgi:ferritin heavy chain
MSQIRQNFDESVENAINDQINMELYASYTYQSMGFHFDRDDISLPGFSHFFLKSSSEEREHAEKFMKYINKRGGRVVLKNIEKPAQDSWGNGLEAMQTALELEKKVNASLLRLHALATEKDDAHFTDFLEAEYLDEQVEASKELGGYVTQLKRVGPGLGEHLFDKQLLEHKE